MQKESAGSSPPLNERKAIQRRRFISLLRSRGALAVVIFLLAFGVRVLTWHDTRLEVGKVQTLWSLIINASLCFYARAASRPSSADHRRSPI
jgi:hypothetical protein